MTRASLTLADLPAARRALEELQGQGSGNANPMAGPVSLHQALHHSAQSLEYGLAGFPQMKPAWFRASIGPLAARVFLARGRLKHGLDAPIPGAPEIPRDGDMPTAFIRLYAAIDAFEQAVRSNAVLKPHFAYGDVAPADYARLQAHHIAEHLDALQR
ncbi:DUF1569 domain-containing protein [Ferrovibrio sp.]|uniref:DUF1569 domain-containing protein n=1 Tax=Ferrovibrio sp. TaxID=1917215 RepID=UPI003D0CD060